MVKQNQIFNCKKCNSLIEILRENNNELCCSDCKLLEEKTQDQGYEKHVPVIETTEEGIKVKIGSNPHPMLEEHFIEWIQVITLNGKSYRQFLKPGDAPEAFFPVKDKNLIVREHCNVHGLWKTEQ